VAIVDVVDPHMTHNVQVHSYHMPAFFKANTCSTVVHPLACAFWEEELGSAHGSLRDEYTTAIIDSYVRGGVPPL
jgi:hypothetical protein